MLKFAFLINVPDSLPKLIRLYIKIIRAIVSSQVWMAWKREKNI